MNMNKINNFYTEQNLDDLFNGIVFINCDYTNILEKYYGLTMDDIESNEYIIHGFLRRLDTIKQCIINIYEIFPPDKIDLLNNDEQSNVTINLHAFYINVFGCIDNLAHAFCKLKSIRIERSAVSFIHPEVKSQLKTQFKDYIGQKDLKKWYQYIENYRDSLAHRIPIYCAPSMKINGEGPDIICPFIKHSFYEKRVPEIKIHSQLISDWKTIVEIADKFYDELIYHKSLSASHDNN